MSRPGNLPNVSYGEAEAITIPGGEAVIDGPEL